MTWKLFRSRVWHRIRFSKMTVILTSSGVFNGGDGISYSCQWTQEHWRRKRNSSWRESYSFEYEYWLNKERDFLQVILMNQCHKNLLLMAWTSSFPQEGSIRFLVAVTLKTIVFRNENNAQKVGKPLFNGFCS